MPLYNPAVTRDGAVTLTNKTLTSPVLQGNVDGWINETGTLTYASASSVTISGDQTAVYTKGTRVKFIQTSTKYFVVTSSSYSAPNTTINFLVNTDYTVANAAITSPAYSYAVNPQGYPGWFNLAAPTWTVSTFDDGAGGQPTTNVYKINIVGNIANTRLNGSGTKAGTDWYVFHNGGNAPTPANYTAATACTVGSGNAGWASNDRPGTFTYHSVNGWGLLFDSHVNIADNQAISVISMNATYEF